MMGGDSTIITVIAQDVNNNEMALDGNANITLCEGSGLGYFKLENDTNCYFNLQVPIALREVEQ